MCSPDMPDPDPAIGEAQRIIADNSTKMLDFFTNYYQETLAPLQMKQTALTERLNEDYLSGRAEQRDVERENIDRFRRLYQPLEEQTVRDAAEYDSAGNIARRSGIAAANVNQAYSNARDQSTRALSRMGINPNSSAFAATNDRLTRAQALDTAGARTGAAFDTMDKGIALRSGAVAQGRGLPNIAGQFAQIGNQSGAQAGAVGAQNLAGAQNVGNFMGQGYSMANAGMAQSGQLGVANYNAQVNAANVAGNPMMEILGMGTRLGAAALMAPSSKEYKTDKVRVSEGAALSALRRMPIEEYSYRPGIVDGGAKRHVGTYAENFQQETGMGDGRSIPIQDAIGVTMAAVKDLDRKVSALMPRKASGGPIDARRGGSIRGPGTATSDSIPAMLSNGEYVLNAESVKMIGKQKLDKMNKAGLKRRALKGR